MDTRETTVAGAPTDDRGRVETDETRNLIASDKVEGTPVYNRPASGWARSTTSWSTRSRGRSRTP